MSSGLAVSVGAARKLYTGTDRCVLAHGFVLEHLEPTIVFKVLSQAASGGSVERVLHVNRI